MAGDWIKMREDLHEDPAVLTMASRLDTRPEHVVGYCHRFWAWASRNCVPQEEGHLSPGDGDTCPDSVPLSVPLASLENVLNLPNFLEMLISVGWLEYREEPSGPVLVVPKFERHLSESAKRRALASEKKRRQRARRMSPRNVESCPPKTGTREEKRREESKTPTESTPRRADTSPASEFSFPTDGKEKTWTLPQAKLDEYAEAFPNLDVRGELVKARQWCRDNVTKRKTARGMVRFLTNWLNRCQDSGRGLRQESSASKLATKEDLDSWTP